MAESVFNVAGLLKVTLPALEGIRGAGGRFGTTGDARAALSAQRQRNGEMAVRLQASVLNQIGQRITRQAASTGRLLRVTAASDNAQYDTWSIGVGNVPFLDSSIAKYWRTFEQGSAEVWSHPFIGTQLYPKGPGMPPFPVAHGMKPGLRTFALSYRPGIGAHVPWMNGERYVVKHEIAPRYAYRNAAEEGRIMEYGLQQAHVLVQSIIGRGIGHA